MQLTQKESSLLKDLKSQEQLCIDKYTKHASCAVDEQLKTLFTNIAGVEQQHLNTLTQIESGTVPSVSGGSDKSAVSQSFSATYGVGETEDKKSDNFLCSDVLAGEKHVSSLYDTCIFEFTQPQLRDVLNHIQKEEQQHAMQIYSYMSANNMYS